MSIFNSLGSNYDLNFAFKALLSSNNKKDKTELKKVLSEKFGGEALLTYKGRQAIEIALKLLNLPKEASVAINGFTCFAVYQAITNAGLNVDYIDIEKDDLNFSPEQFKNALRKNPQIKAVIIQNTLGYPVEVEKIADICKEKNIILIEDLAHSVGTIYKSHVRAGELGDLVTLSFSQDKIIDAISGGALIIRNGKYQNKVSNFNDLNQKDVAKDRWYPAFTYLIRNTYQMGLGKIIHALLKSLNLLSKPMDNSPIPTTIASWYGNLAKTEFYNLDKNLNHRKKIAGIYAENIDKKILSSKLVQNIPYSTNLRFPIFVNNRSELINFLKKQNIFVSDIWYDAPIAPKKYMAQTNYRNQCPNAEKISETILNLPTHKNVSEEQAKRISGLINQWLSRAWPQK